MFVVCWLWVHSQQLPFRSPLLLRNITYIVHTANGAKVIYQNYHMWGILFQLYYISNEVWKLCGTKGNEAEKQLCHATIATHSLRSVQFRRHVLWPFVYFSRAIYFDYIQSKNFVFIQKHGWLLSILDSYAEERWFETREYAEKMVALSKYEFQLANMLGCQLKLQVFL